MRRWRGRGKEKEERVEQEIQRLENIGEKAEKGIEKEMEA